MGKMTFSPIQTFVFEAIGKNQSLRDQFYFTGGTALAIYHLQHRYSDDLDFFSEKDFLNEPIIAYMSGLAKEKSLDATFTQIETTRIFEFRKKDELELKVDFAWYPFHRIDPGTLDRGISIDSMLDIAANKIMTINQRTEVKDYVDLYFLLQKFTLWDMLYAHEKKFGIKIDLVLLTADMLKVESFEYLPKMIKPITLPILKKFFISKAKELGKRITE